MNMVVRRNGWLYVYLSNESAQDVFFDNLVINHKRGPLVEEKFYYAFGMEVPGECTQAFKQTYDQNRYRYNGIEYDSAFGLDEYEAHFRELDPQIGRWTTIDPKIDEVDESITPYASMSNNPVFRTDPLGDVPDGCCGGILHEIKEDLSETWNSLSEGAVNVVTQINASINPLATATEIVTGKSTESNFTVEKSRVTSTVEGAMFVLPGLKIENAIVKTGEKAITAETEKVASSTADKAATKLSGTITEPNLPAKTVVKEGDVEIVHYTRSGDHGPAHLHVEGGGKSTRIGQNGKPLKGSPELSSAQKAAVDANKSQIRKAVKQIMKWNRFNNQ